MTDKLDLSAYFARVGFSGPATPTLETLRALSEAHVSSIPFENLNVLLGQPIELESEALFDKLVRRQRGGYCFEQNGLFLEVLRAIGFEAVPMSARVRLRHPRSHTPARTHVFVRVLIEGAPWLADVGVGAASLTAPLRFDSADEQATPHETRRIVEGDATDYPKRRFHQIKYGTDWTDVYEFTGEEMPFIDRVVGNWYTSTHPTSHFKDRLMVSRALPEGRRVTILNRDFTIREANGQGTTTSIASPQILLDLLRMQFGLTGFDEADATRLFSVGESAK